MAKSGWSQLFCLAFCFFVLGGVHCDTGRYVRTGKSATLETGIKGDITLIVWKFVKNGIITKMVEWDKADGAYWYSGKDRANISSTNGDLTLSNMIKEHSGLYTVEIVVNGATRNFEFSVTVMDGVSNPTVKCEGGENTLNLTCSASPSLDVTFTWGGPNGFKSKGPAVSITENLDRDAVYFCTAENNVSKSTTELKLAECPQVPGCKWCIPVVVVIVVVLFIIATAGLIYYKFFRVQQSNPPVKNENTEQESEALNDYVNVDTHQMQENGNPGEDQAHSESKHSVEE